MPLSVGDDAVAEFINDLGVNNVTHVLGSDSLWGEYGATGTPSWMTITADGQTQSGSGAFPDSVIDGSWTS